MFDQRLAGWLASVLGVLLVLVGGAWWFRRKPRTSVASDDDDRLDTVGGWPPTVTRLMTPAERTAFGILRTALPEYVVLSQVPLARFIEVSKRNSYAEWLRRVGNQSIDFLICDSSSKVIAVVDLQAPAAQAPPRAAKRQTRIARTLKAAKVPLHVWTNSSLPSVEVARDSILRPPKEPLLPPARPADVPVAIGARTAADSTTPGSARAANPFEDTGRDSSQDEFIEAQEPPPSTWYDDFDSGPTPLAPDKRRQR